MNQPGALVIIARMCIFLLLNGVYLIGPGQSTQLSGRVLDAETGEPLAFVNLVANSSRQGTASDIDGKFSLHLSKPAQFLKATYVGYEPARINVAGRSQNLKILMRRIPYELDEVVILPGINSAHRIIRNVVNNRHRNDPAKLEAYSYISYEKTIFTLDLDSLRMIDTMLLDTASLQVRRFFDRQDIFIAESVTERKYLRPERKRENVIATRVSGMKDPIFVFLVSQMQSTSFYNERINIGRSEYINPISGGSTSKYTFILEDTAYSDRNDTIFIISYRPAPNTNFDGLKGVLSINTYNWAVQNVIAEPARDEGPFTIRIQQQYELIDGKQWFPVQLNTDIMIRSIGTSVNDEMYSFVGVGKSYIRDIELNPRLLRSEFDNIEVDVDPRAHDRSEEFWNVYRADSLSERDRNTYEFMDSIGREVNFDRLAKTFETVMTGRIPFKVIDFDIDKFLRYNQYEGLYLGLGIHTNERLSRRFKAGGFWGYSFNDKTAKYGGDGSVLIHRRSDLKLKAGYFYDVTESAGTEFNGEPKSFLRAEGFRNFLIRRMNVTERGYVGLEFNALRHFRWELLVLSDFKKAFPDYYYGQREGNTAMLKNEFRFTELTAGFRFAFREKFLRTKRMKISLGTKYPVIRFQYTRGFDNILSGEFAYNRYDLKISESFYIKYLGLTAIELRAGYIDGDLPYCNLYNGNGSYRVFTVYASNSFATMRMNEFLSNRFVALYLSHNFGTLLVRTRFFSPEIMLVTNIGFGKLNNAAQHHNTSFNTMEKGFYESGVLFHGLLDLSFYKVGVGMFYRYGPYSFEKTIDNFAFKASIVFPIESVKRQ
ncbi:MAG: DUF5686 family protein [Bacteroidales bacterium]|nr:DUF5686 family protein [Bacteroidales bacterium]